MQPQHNKSVPRLRAFERINAAAYDRLKDEWECDPSSIARCSDAKQQIWEINDLSMGIWVSVCLVTNYCWHGKQVCQHIQLARHIAACGNNPVNAQATISCGFRQQAVYAAQQAGSVTDQNARQQLQEFNRMLKVSTLQLYQQDLQFA